MDTFKKSNSYFHFAVAFIGITMLLLGAGCAKKGSIYYVNDSSWIIAGLEDKEGDKTIFENNVLYAETDFGASKLSIKFGSDPKNLNQKPLKVVDYFKVPLAADEVVIGLKQEGSFYLSTGTDNVTITPIVTVDINTNSISNISVTFTNTPIKVQRNDTQFNPFEVTTVKGYINLNY